MGTISPQAHHISALSHVTECHRLDKSPTTEVDLARDPRGWEAWCLVRTSDSLTGPRGGHALSPLRAFPVHRAQCSGLGHPGNTTTLAAPFAAAEFWQRPRSTEHDLHKLLALHSDGHEGSYVQGKLRFLPQPTGGHILEKLTTVTSVARPAPESHKGLAASLGCSPQCVSAAPRCSGLSSPRLGHIALSPRPPRSPLCCTTEGAGSPGALLSQNWRPLWSCGSWSTSTPPDS